MHSIWVILIPTINYAILIVYSIPIYLPTLQVSYFIKNGRVQFA